MVHRRPGWYAAVRMNSVRVRPIEDDTNGDNALGRYFSDGVCLVMRSGAEYENITACWDWTRLPGSTLPATPVYTREESAKRGLRVGGKVPRWTHSVAFRPIGETGFVGGVTDGTHGVAVYTMNLDGVKAKKAYFFDTDAVYELGSGISSTAYIKMEKNGEILEGVAYGHGPIDAAFLAVDKIIGIKYELDDFQIKSVTEGKEAMGMALVKLRQNGKLYSGNGISTDIIGSSIRAYVNAINKIAYEENI